MLSREGWLLLAFSAAVGFGITQWLGVGYALPAWLLAGLTVYLFRDPDRDVPSSALGVVAPVDGQVSSIESAQDPYLKRQAIRVSLSMDFWGVYTTRSPVEGYVIDRWFRIPSEAAGEPALRFALWLQTDAKDDLVISIVKSSWINSPRCFVQTGERIGQGQRCGHIRFGNQIDLYLPECSRIFVKPGDRVKAGSDLIASLIHKQAPVVTAS